MAMTQPARIAFAGTPEFAVPTLAGLIARGYRVETVLTQPDRPAGRGRQLTPSPVKRVAVENSIDVMQPARLDEAARAALRGREPDVLVVIAYGLILPRWMLAWPRVAPVNVHASLLPRWRGAAPIQHAILAGDAESGISIMHIESGLDTGPVYAERATSIRADDTAGSLHDRLAELGSALLLEALPKILSAELKPVAQPEEGACYADKIEKRDARLDFSRPAVELERIVRAYNPWPVAEAVTDSGLRLRVWQARAVDESADGAAGAIVATGPAGIDVATAAGILRLQSVQPPGGRAMDAAAYLAAHSLDGVRFVDA